MKISFVLLATLSITMNLLAQPVNHDMGTPNQTNNPMIVHGMDGDVSRLLMITRGQYAGHLGHYISSDTGATWSGSNTVPGASGGQNPWVAIDKYSGYAYATWSNHVARSTDWGNHWDTPLFVDPGTFDHETNIAVDNGAGSAYQGRVYMSSVNGLYVSKDSGVTFTYDSLQPISSHGQMQTIVVDGNGVVFDFYDADPVTGSYSTNGGLTWNTISFDVTINSAGGGIFRDLAAAASTTNGFVCLTSVFSYRLEILWTNGIGSGWHKDTVPMDYAHESTFMPAIAVDDDGRMFIGFYYQDVNKIANVNSADTSQINPYLLKLAASQDRGQTWGITTVSSDTFHLLTSDHVSRNYFEDGGLGINFGLTIIDSSHVGVAWADNRNDPRYFLDSVRTYFANVSVGTLFRNAFDQTYAYSCVVFPQSDTTKKDTVVSQGNRLLKDSANYYVRPDVWRHDNVNTASNNFVFHVWNKSSVSPPPDNNFTHLFTGKGILNQIQEASHVHIDALTCNINFENATADSVKWEIGTDPFLTTLSPLDMDTARRSTAENTFLYTFKPKDTVFTALGTTWRCEDRWIKNDTLLSTVSSTLDTVKLTGPTNLVLQFKGEMRSDGDFSFNNQRKLCWDDIGKRLWLCYASHGNIYLSFSTDTTFNAISGCHWSVEKRINSDYGNCTNPSIAWLPPPTSDSAHTKRTSSGAVAVTWEDTLLTGDIITRTKQVSMFDRYGNVIGGMDNVSLPFEGDSSQLPSAPMVCRVATYPDTGIHGTYYADAAIVWCDNTSAVVCLLNKYCSPLPAVNYIERIPNTGGARLAAIEPGFNRADTSRHDAVDFNISMHDTNGNVKYIYATLNCTPCGSTKMCYSTPDTVWDTTEGGMNANVSMAVSDSAEPFYAWEQSGIVMAIKLHNPECDTVGGIVHCWLPEFRGVVRQGIVTRAKSKHSSTNWGGLVSRMAYASVPTYITWAAPPYISPTASIYKNQPGNGWLYFCKNGYNTDSIQSCTLNLSPTSGNRLVPDSIVKTDTNGPGRTPIVTNGRIVTSTQNRYLWIKDSASTENIHRSGTCDAPNNSRPDGGFANKSLHVRLNDSAHFEYHVGEMAIIDPGTGTKTIQHKPMNMTTPITSKADAVAQMKSEYFHVASDTVKIVSFVTPMVNDSGKAIGGLGSTGVLQFKFCLYDSSTGSLLQSLSMTQFSGAGTHVSGVIGADTQIVIGQNGKTCYLQMSVDTSGISSSISFVPVLEITEQKLSDVINDTTNGMAKAIAADRGRGGEAIALPNPLNLMIGPNPTSTSAHIMYTIPVDDADQVVEVLVIGMNGSNIKQLFHDIQPEGKYSVTFDGTNLPVGNYVAAVHTKNHQASKLIGIVR